MKKTILNLLLHKDEAIKYTVTPSQPFLEKKYKKLRRNAAIDLFKWVSVFIIIVFLGPILLCELISAGL